MGTACSLLAARTVGNSRKAEVDRGLRYLDGLRASATGETAGESWAGAAVWDSARAGEILLLSRVWKPQQCLALAELLVQQIHEDGLCGFDLGVRLSDHDSSSAALGFFAKTWSLLERNAPSWLGGAVERLVEGLIAGQHDDGGWGFAPGKPFFRSGGYPPGELKAMAIDASSPDLTARVLLGLSAAVRSGCLDVLIADQVDHAVQRALKYLKAEQDADGSWWARWSEGRVLSTAWALIAVCAAAADPKDPMIVKGRTWILANATATDIPAEISSCLAALIVTSEQNRIDEDSFTRDLVERIISGQEDGTWKSLCLYPLVYGVDRFSAPLFDHCTVTLALLLVERAMLKGCEQARREILWGRLRPMPLPRRAVDTIEMARIYQEFLELGQRLAGAPTSIGQRIVVHYSVYRDSRRNLTFPVLALHGAGWAQGYFDLLGLVLPWYASLRFPFSWRKRDEFKNKMSLAMTGFKVANQRVLRDTFANYHFTKKYGTTPGADKVLPPTLLTTLNQLHAATSTRESLTDVAKSAIYSECFQWEQHNSVWPMVEKAIKGVNDPLVKAIAFRPIVHFRFFPPLRFLFFHNFTDTNERIAQGWKAYRIAEEVGWAVTERAIGKFDFVPLDMTEYYVRLLNRLEPPKEFER
jgi:hypothetical protein